MADRFVLADSNILIHLTNPQSVEYSVSRRAASMLGASGAQLFYTSQNLAEFWNVSTRSAPGGLGLSIEESAVRVKDIEEQFLEDYPLDARLCRGAGLWAWLALRG
jgi:hypothetical protein